MFVADAPTTPGAILAERIVVKLGGPRFAMLTGSGYFTEIEGGVSFRIGTNARGLRGCKVLAQEDGAYTIKFVTIAKRQIVERFVKPNLTIEQCLEHFETITGLGSGL